MGKKDPFKKFRQVKDSQNRLYALAEWCDKIFRSFVFHKREFADRVKYIANAEKDAIRFCGRPLLDEWCLDKEWFRYLFVQTVYDNNDGAKVFCKALGWNIDKYSNPVYDERTTVQPFKFFNEDWTADLVLTTVGAVTVGSVWENKKSGVKWQVISKIGDQRWDMEPVEYQAGMNYIERDERDILKSFRKVAA